MQLNLPFREGLLYECANAECDGDGHLWRATEVNWVHFWNSEIDDLDLRSVCPLCSQPMMIWEEEEKDGKIQTFV